ncbi:Aste57867_15951 [Aphanomyces stellatus]|uniref:nitric oxide dioxygenase n=1 Tax=Aphanomyces stellatus TaxID=120398 RepID=A0A485L4C8_9STRA|nr:hypothetical protein As57867_015895 [Aphanomyces stellatus]VFT92736.1 Aste57867_15951 [Aphanomyces stellatus]
MPANGRMAHFTVDNMGGALSSRGSEVITVADDGTTGLIPVFLKYFRDEVPPPFNLSHPSVSPTQVAIIQANWHGITQGTSAFDPAKHLTPTKFFYNTFYQTLFTTSPALRSIFRSSMTTQGKTLAGTLRTLVTIANGGKFVETVQAIAERHLGLGIAKQHYKDFGVVLLSTLEAVSGDSWSRGVKEAYFNAYALCLYVMMPIIAGDDPVPMPESLSATITQSDALSPTAKRITLTFDYALKYYPGDAVWLGLPGDDRRHFVIISFPDDDADENVLSIFVDDSCPSSHWLCTQSPGATVQLFWIESDVRFETDTPEVLPQHVVFVSYGIGCIPFITMVEGLSRIGDDRWQGSVVTLQCGPSPHELEPYNERVPTTGKRIAWEKSTVFFSHMVTAAKLKEIVPHLALAELYVSGPKSFVATAKDAWVAAGGSPDRMNWYSLAADRRFSMSDVSLSALKLAESRANLFGDKGESTIGGDGDDQTEPDGGGGESIGPVLLLG